jgi:hypothetical protein
MWKDKIYIINHVSVETLGVFLFSFFTIFVLHIPQYIITGSKNGLVKSISISPCPHEPCFLKRDTNVSVSIVFTSSK